MAIFNLHTHHNNQEPGTAIVNLPTSVLENPESFCPEKEVLYSAGIFPLYEGNWESALGNLEKLAERGVLKAIGECGLDKRSTIKMEVQQKWLGKQMDLAERLEMPLIIHCVKSWEELLEVHTAHLAKQLRIIHGFRGKPQLAQQLLKAGFCLSFGWNYNEESFQLCPEDKRFCETDDNAEISIEEVAAKQGISHKMAKNLLM